MIHPDEAILWLGEVPDYVRDTFKRPCTKQSVYRWSRTGLNRHRLETLKVAGRLYTSREALFRFFDHVANSPTRPASPRPRAMTREEAARLVS